MGVATEKETAGDVGIIEGDCISENAINGRHRQRR